MDLIAISDGYSFRISTIGKVLNFILVLFICASYIPQYLRIKRRGSDGISPIFIILHSVYAASALANVLVIAASWKRQQGCREKYPLGKCMLEMMDYWQFAADWIGSTAILILYLYTTSDRTLNPFQNQEYQEDDQQDSQQDGQQAQQAQSDHPSEVHAQQQSGRRGRSVPFRLAIGIGIFLEVILLIPSLFFGINPRILAPGYSILIQAWSFGTVYFTAILAVIYILPQLWYTWSLGRVGNLSLLTMAIQIPTYFLVAASLAFQYGQVDEIPPLGRWEVAWNPWMNLFVKGCYEAIILALCIYLYKKSITRETDPPQVVNEQTPLLSDRQDNEAT